MPSIKPRKDALSRPPQHAPAQKNDTGEEDKPAASLERVDKDLNSAAEKDIQRSWTEGFLSCWQLLLQGGMLVQPAQQAGRDCQGCKHITMATEHHKNSRRKFFWRCERGHRQLEIGFNGERILIAPPECEDYEPPEEKKWC